MLDRETALGRAIPIVERAQKEGVNLKLIGGLAVAYMAKEGSKKFPRQYKDLDFFGFNSCKKGITELFKESDMKPNVTFNALHGATRLIYFDNELRCSVDVLIDEFKMCHEIKLKDRMMPSCFTISPSDLLLTKMQTVTITENDLRDVAALLCDFQIGNCDGKGELDGCHIARLLSEDWGFYTTFEHNVRRLLSYLSDRNDCEVPVSRIKTLWDMIESAPKGFKWKMRAKVGEKVKWYEEPEESRLSESSQPSPLPAS